MQKGLEHKGITILTFRPLEGSDPFHSWPYFIAYKWGVILNILTSTGMLILQVGDIWR